MKPCGVGSLCILLMFLGGCDEKRVLLDNLPGLQYTAIGPEEIIEGLGPCVRAKSPWRTAVPGRAFWATIVVQNNTTARWEDVVAPWERPEGVYWASPYILVDGVEQRILSGGKVMLQLGDMPSRAKRKLLVRLRVGTKPPAMPRAAQALYEPPGDFAEYRVYRSRAPFDDVSAMTPIATITDPSQMKYTDATTTDGVDYYYAVTCVDDAGNENKSVTCVGPVQSVNNLLGAGYVPLMAGWNLMAVPFACDADYLRIERGGELKELQEAVEAEWIAPPIWGWSGTKYVGIWPGEAPSRVEPLRGYFLLAADGCRLVVLHMPPPPPEFEQ